MCHPSQAAGYAQTPMGRSFAPAIIRAASVVRHAGSRTEVTITPDKFQIRSGRLLASYPAVWQIGSGSHAAGYLTTIAGQLFQAPVAYYPNRNLWDVAPGYENLPHIDFNRRVTPECLFCHTSQSAQITPVAISCERCHGNAEPHALHPTKTNVTNPARLPPAQRAAVCEQCHLNGEARIPQPNRKLEDFRPGQALEDYLAIFVAVSPAEELKVISHSEQLAQSKCGPLWCGSCHKVHGEAVSITKTCQGCHAQRPASHPRTEAACETCHMPKRQAVDGLHTAFTDHRIRRPGPPAPTLPTALALRAWRPGPNGDRNRGLALLAAGERNGSAAQLQESFRILSAAYPTHPNDPELLAALGSLLFLKDQREDAAKLLRAAIRLRPAFAPYHQKLGIILQSEAELNEAIRLDPYDETNYHLLAALVPSRKRETLERFLQINPQHLSTRKALN